MGSENSCGWCGQTGDDSEMVVSLNGEEWLCMSCAHGDREEQIRRLYHWTPRPVNVNALPEAVRDYVHRLEARCDPAGEVAENTMLKDENTSLTEELTRLRKVEMAARHLLDKLDAIESSSEYQRVFGLATVRGHSYAGPQWGEERDALREALEKGESDV